MAHQPGVGSRGRVNLTANAVAMRDSVTVSIGELTKGTLSLIFFVNAVVSST